MRAGSEREAQLQVDGGDEGRDEQDTEHLQHPEVSERDLLRFSAVSPVDIHRVAQHRDDERQPKAFGGDLSAARYTLADVLDGQGRHDEAAELRRQIGGDAAPDDG